MKTPARLLLIPVAAIIAAGCELTAPPGEDPVYIKLDQVDGRLTRVERVLENDSLMTLVEQLDQLQQELRELRNDVESLQHDVEQNGQRQRSLYQDVDQRLQAMEQRTAGQSGAAAAVVSGGAPPVAGSSDRTAYRAAFDLLKQGRYEQAGDALRQFIAAFPTSELAGNAQYWLAETYYVTQQYDKALPEFNQVIERYRDSPKIPDALLKIGYCHYELSHWEDARTALRAVATDYPETTAARLARQRLERMKAEQR